MSLPAILPGTPPVIVTGESTAAAKQSATAAVAQAVKAGQWAENPEDVPVEPSQFSAKHYAIKAQLLASTTAGVRDQAVAALDAAQLPTLAYDTRADAEAAANDPVNPLADGAKVLIYADEDHDDATTMNQVVVNDDPTPNDVEYKFTLYDRKGVYAEVQAFLTSSTNNVPVGGVSTAGPYQYKRAPAVAVDHHVTDGAGIGYYVLPDIHGLCNVAALGAALDVATTTDDSVYWQQANTLCKAGAFLGISAPAGQSHMCNFPMDKQGLFIYAPYTTIRNNIAGNNPCFVSSEGDNFDHARITLFNVQSTGQGGPCISLEGGDVNDIHWFTSFETRTAFPVLTNANDTNNETRWFRNRFIGQECIATADCTADYLFEFETDENKLSVLWLQFTDIRLLSPHTKFAKFASTHPAGSTLNEIRVVGSQVEKAQAGFIEFWGCNISGVDSCTFYDMETTAPKGVRMVSTYDPAADPAVTPIAVGQTLSANAKTSGQTITRTVIAAINLVELTVSASPYPFFFNDNVTLSDEGDGGGTGTIEKVSWDQKTIRLQTTAGTIAVGQTVTTASGASALVTAVKPRQFLWFNPEDNQEWKENQAITVDGNASSGHTVLRHGFIEDDLIVFRTGDGQPTTQSRQGHVRTVQRNNGTLGPGAVDIRTKNDFIVLHEIGSKLNSVPMYVDCENNRIEAYTTYAVSFMRNKQFFHSGQAGLIAPGISFQGDNTVTFQTNIVDGRIAIGGPGFYSVLVEGNANDDLDWIDGPPRGAGFLLLTSANSRDITLKHLTGNIFSHNGKNYTIPNQNYMVLLVWNPMSGFWTIIGMYPTATALTANASSGTLPVANGSITIADAAAPTNAELLEYIRELHAVLTTAGIAA